MLRFLGLVFLLLIAVAVFRPQLAPNPAASSAPTSATAPPAAPNVEKSKPAEKATLPIVNFDNVYARYGKPDVDDTTAYDKPRPPFVSRWFIYKKQNVRLMFLADVKQLGDPPPYKQWRYVGAIDEKTNDPLKADEIERRFASRAPGPKKGDKK